ncbi:putative RNA-binding protein [Lachnellula hyalina]|uniref:Putative RNA-binding protein n=1 Tax=Lachnellula hyalina TaxID=1316788 RepID=A0A8H8QVX2_9HELO|nr:putative RNA-binding protein [Lachnellula hyalina]TVY23135.1 putative RNA-binding protein [Lachnellula hyalina]
MSYHRPPRPPASTSQDSNNMYEDPPYEANQLQYEYHDASPQGYRKDNTRTPPRGPAGERMNESDRYQRDERDGNGHGRERSRSPRWEGRGRYTDRDREGYRSPPRNRSRSRSPYFGGPPNRNVILEGLPTDMTQEDILNELRQSFRLEGLEEVRLIKDKRTGVSRQFAFAQFVGILEARRFLEQYYPTVALYGAYPNQATSTQPAQVRIAFSRDDRDKSGKSEDDWRCEVCYASNFSTRTLCYRCNAPRTRATAHGVFVAQGNISSFSGFAATGDSDASPDGTASQFLLLRGLEPGVNEELLAKGAIKLYKTKATTTTPPGDAPVAKKTKIASTSNDSSAGAKDGSLRRVLLVRDRQSNDSWKYGFAEFNTVEDAQAAMMKYKASEKFTISSKPVMVSYIHAGVFVPVLHPLGDEFANFTFSPLSNAAVKLMYWDEAAYASEFVIATADQSTVSKNKETEHAKLAAAAAGEGLVVPGKEGEPRSKKRKVEKDTKVVAPHLKFWTNKHAEIHGGPAKNEDVTSDTAQMEPVTKVEEEVAESLPGQTFADLERKCCLLCSRQFRTEPEVNKHERISQLHRDNMKDEKLVAKALAKMRKSSESVSENSAYRDRAKERRQAFNQPKQPAAQHNRPKASGTLATKEEEEAPVTSKGAALLGKMGWTAGEGLGAQGSGRTDAITTELYAQGVGLGAQGGKVGDAVEEAHRQTKGSYADFLNKTKDKAKERFDSLT